MTSRCWRLDAPATESSPARVPRRSWPGRVVGAPPPRRCQATRRVCGRLGRLGAWLQWALAPFPGRFDPSVPVRVVVGHVEALRVNCHASPARVPRRSWPGRVVGAPPPRRWAAVRRVCGRLGRLGAWLQWALAPFPGRFDPSVPVRVVVGHVEALRVNCQASPHRLEIVGGGRVVASRGRGPRGGACR